MSLTRPIVSQINTADIEQTAFASNAQVDTLQSNLSSFASYSNSTFSTGSSFTAGVLFDEPIQQIPSENANSAYATSNVISIATPVNSRDNLLVYLDGLLQHPDTYIVTETTLQFANVEPIPSSLTVGVRHLQVDSNLVLDTETSNSIVGANGMLAWDYESKRLRVYDGSTIGGFFANATISVNPYSFQGEVSGYSSGGWPGSGNSSNIIDKFPFASNFNASDVGDLTQGRFVASGQSSLVSGYTSGGRSYPPDTNVIDKFPFASNANAIDVGDLSSANRETAGHSTLSNGYASGGSPTSRIDKFPFSTDSSASNIGNLSQGRYGAAGQSSSTHGYTSGGQYPVVNTIDKFSFSIDGNSTNVGDLTISRRRPAGQSSSTYGYTSGGSTNTPSPSITYNTIDKFPFSSDSNASDVGDLTQARLYLAGQSSTSSGYSSGGWPPTIDTIDKFPFASDANATDVGNLTQGRYAPTGQQV